MFKLSQKNKFSKQLELAKKRGCEIWKMEEVVKLLVANKPLPPYLRNHKLQGDYKGCWECHIEPDWLLIYIKIDNEIILFRTGTHSDLF